MTDKKRADPSRTGSLKNEKVVFNYEQKGLSEIKFHFRVPVCLVRHIIGNASLMKFLNALCRNTPLDEFACDIIGSGGTQRIVYGSCTGCTVRRSRNFYGQSVFLSHMSERIKIDLARCP